MKNIILFVPRFFKESWEELKKVSWPTTKQTMRLSLVVVVVSVLFSVFISGVDFALKQGIDAVKGSQPTAPGVPAEGVPLNTEVPVEGAEE